MDLSVCVRTGGTARVSSSALGSGVRLYDRRCSHRHGGPWRPRSPGV